MERCKTNCYRGAISLKMYIRYFLTHCGRVTHICVSKLTSTCFDIGLSPGRLQAIIWATVKILWIGSLKSLRHEKKTIFTAIIFVYTTFYGLHHQYHTENAQNRTSPQHSIKFSPPAVAGKKCTTILFTVARARFKCVIFIVNQTCYILRRRSESVMKTVNSIIAHVTN